MAKKILIISPTPTHPTNAGNRVRILNMASYLISQGHQVHFLYSRQEKADEDAMRRYWGDRLHLVDYKKPGQSSNQKRIRMIRQRISIHYRYYCSIDEHYNELLDEIIINLDKQFHFDAVLAEYIFQSRAFLNFKPGVLKVIDTHDVMTDRHKLFLKEGKQPVWYSTPYGQEKKGVRRADVIIAIQEKEKAHFGGMTRKLVVNVGHIVKMGMPAREKPRKKLLFVGSDNPSNHYGIIDFIEKDFPAVREAFPTLELLIAGNICRRLENIPDGVRLLGELADLSVAYDQADLILNPLTIGTGLKIKMIEAMGLSKVVFSTPVGADGLEDSAGQAYLLYRNSDELVREMKAVFNIEERYKGICNKAANVAEEWNQKNGAWLDKVFSDKVTEDDSPKDSANKEIPGIASSRNLKDVINQSPDIKKFVIISIPRSGSNLLVGLIGSHKEIVCFPELFHPNAIYDAKIFAKNNLEPYPIEKRNEDPLAFLEYIYKNRYEKKKKASMIGFKIFPGQNDQLLSELIREPSIKKIILIRKNYLQNFLSQKTAQKSQVYFIRSGSGKEMEDVRIEVNGKEFIGYEKRFRSFFADVLEQLNESGQEFFKVHYKELLQEEHQIRLLKFLEVTPDPGLLAIRSEKQNKLTLKQKVLNYEELKEILIESGKERYLEQEDV